MRDNRNMLPMWLGGLLLALVLIVISNRAGGGINNPALMQRFAPRPTDPNAPTAQPYQLPRVSLPSLPPGVQRAVTSLRELGIHWSVEETGRRLAQRLQERLGAERLTAAG